MTTDMDVPPSVGRLGSKVFAAELCKLGVCYGEYAGGFFADLCEGELGFGQVRHLHPILTEGADAAARALRKVSGAQHQLCLPFADAVFYGVEAHHQGPALRQRESANRILPGMRLSFLRPGPSRSRRPWRRKFLPGCSPPARGRCARLCALWQDMPRWGTRMRRARAFCPSGPAKPCRPPHAPRAPVPFSVCFRRSRCSGEGVSFLASYMSPFPSPVRPLFLGGGLRRFLHGGSSP